MNRAPQKPTVGIVMGSDSDLPIMEEAAKVLARFGIPYELRICSAHRSPRRAIEYAQTAESRGLKVVIAGAGGAAHLAGILAAETVLPVIGVPIDSSPLHGFDALLSIAQMPGGVPVATMAVGRAGAKNAGVLAAEILAISDPLLNGRLKEFKLAMAKEVEAKDAGVNTPHR